MQTNMQFKSFIWQHNPSQFQSRLRRKTASLKYPSGKFVLQDIGISERIFFGRGEFFGKNAYNQFRALAKVFCEDGAGVLYHPTWGSCSAFFTQLQLLQPPEEDYVAYAFEFLAAAPTSSEFAQQQTTAVVQAGQTLEQVCAEQGVSLQTVLECNPSIANPAKVAEGTEVVIAWKGKF